MAGFARAGTLILHATGRGIASEENEIQKPLKFWLEAGDDHLRVGHSRLIGDQPKLHLAIER
jgi:hypothetical protein